MTISGPNKGCLDFPQLFKLILLIREDNGIPMRLWRDIIFTGDMGYDWPELERQAKLLSPEEAEMFCCGEVSEMDALADDLGLEDLSKALNEIFDGELSPYFWVV